MALRAGLTQGQKRELLGDLPSYLLSVVADGSDGDAKMAKRELGRRDQIQTMAAAHNRINALIDIQVDWDETPSQQ